MEISHFGVVDYIVVGIVLAISALIGVYFRLTGGKQRTVSEYIMADKNMSFFPVTCSLIVSNISAVLLLGQPREIYIYGTQMIFVVFGIVLRTILMVYLFLPVFFKLQAVSAYEYLEQRFGRITRIIASTTFITQTVLYMSVVLYAPAIALNTVTGISKYTSILAVGIVCTFYCTIGGMKAVLWTDLFQSILVLVAAFAVMAKGVIDSNGFTETWNTAANGGRIIFFNFNPDLTVRYTVWTQIIGVTVYGLGAFCITQTQVQRLMTLKNLRKSQFAYLLTLPFIFILFLIVLFVGLSLYSKYRDCDPFLSKRITTPDQLVPLFVMDYLSFLPGLAGLVVSGIFSATLSSISSAVNSLAAATLEDFVKPALPERWRREKVLIFISKVLACTYGVFCVSLAFLADQLGGLIQAMLTVLGVVGGPMLGLYTLGMFVPRCTERGVLTGFIVSISFAVWIAVGNSITKPFTPHLPLSVDGCQTMANGTGSASNYTSSFNNLSMEVSASLSYNDSFVNDELVTSYPQDRDENNFYLYRISPMWYSVFGFLIMMLVGFLVSLTEEKPIVNADLLNPMCKYWYPTVYSITPVQEQSHENTRTTKSSAGQNIHLVSSAISVSVSNGVS